MKRVFRILALAAMLSVAASAFAEDLDGRWVGEGKRTAACTNPVSLAFTIKGKQVAALELTGSGVTASDGVGLLKADGTMAVSFGDGRLKGMLSFEGSNFGGKLSTSCGLVAFRGVRQ